MSRKAPIIHFSEDELAERPKPVLSANRVALRDAWRLVNREPRVGGFGSLPGTVRSRLTRSVADLQAPSAANAGMISSAKRRIIAKYAASSSAKQRTFIAWTPASRYRASRARMVATVPTSS